jgi:hypothetical protein
MRTKILVSLVVLALIGTAAWSGMGQSQRAARVSYEYQVIDDFANRSGAEEGLKNLNRLGSQGWEVVAVTTEGANYPPKVWLKRVKR